MSLIPVVIGASEEYGVYTVKFRIIDDVTQKPHGPAREVQARNKNDLKEKIRPHVRRHYDKIAQEATLMALAQEALAEVIAEETGG